MAEEAVSPPVDDNVVSPQGDQIIEKQAGEGSESNSINDNSQKIEFTPHQVKRIKNLSYNLKVMRDENDTLKSELKKMRDDYTKFDDKGIDDNFDDLFNDQAGGSDIDTLIDRKLEMKEKLLMKQKVLSDMGIRTNAEAEKFGKGLEVVADNLISVNPSLPYEQALRFAYDVKNNKNFGIGNDTNDEIAVMGSGVGGQSMNNTASIISPRVADMAKGAGVSDDILQEYIKLKNNNIK